MNDKHSITAGKKKTKTNYHTDGFLSSGSIISFGRFFQRWIKSGTGNQPPLLSCTYQQLTLGFLSPAIAYAEYKQLLLSKCLSVSMHFMHSDSLTENSLKHMDYIKQWTYTTKVQLKKTAQERTQKMPNCNRCSQTSKRMDKQ